MINIENIKKQIKIIKEYIPAIYLAMSKQETPFIAKMMSFITISYVLSPIDLIPDFIPVLGYLDDLLIVPVLIVITIRLIPKEILEKCKEEAKTLRQNGKPKKWFYGIPIILIWVFVAFIFISKIK